jgi:hypothetical protein
MWTLAQKRTQKDDLERCNSDVLTDGLVMLMFLDLCKAEFLWLGQLAAIALAQSLPTTFFLRVELFKVWNLKTDDIQYGITVGRFAERYQELSPAYALAQVATEYYKYLANFSGASFRFRLRNPGH